MAPRDAIARFEAAAIAAGGTFRPYGADKFRSVGVCHDARRNESLVFFYDPEPGRVDPYCHAGCDRDRILDALALINDDRYDEPKSRTARDPWQPRPAPKPRPAAPEPRIYTPAPHGWRPQRDPWMPCGHRKIAEYLYADAESCVAFGVCRCERKDFRQWRPDPEARGGRRWSIRETDAHGNVLATVPALPYRLPQILAAIAEQRVIWICEGEKDVRAILDRPGCVATCNAEGAGKWTDAHAAHLKGADVCVVADRDDAGRAHAEKVVDTLMSVANSIEVVQSAHGKDASDHFAGGGHTGNFIRVAEPKPYVHREAL